MATLAERLQFCFIIVFITHVLIIFGITWKPLGELKPSPIPTLDITITTTPSKDPVSNPKFLAPTHQEASSPVDTELAPQHTQAPQLTTYTVENTVQLPQPESVMNSQEQQHDIITSIENPDLTSAQSDIPENSDSANFMSEQQQLLNERIATLAADLALQQQQYAQQPRKRTVTAATLQAEDAQYLYTWRKRMERIGNQNYPEQARRLNLNGDVLLLVAINADGTLYDVQVLKSSGHKILDAAALRIVRLATPFDPLPQEIRANTDILEIIRTWQFGDDHWKVN